MKTEAAPRNTTKPGDKLGRYNGNPNRLGDEAHWNRQITRQVRYHAITPMHSIDKMVEVDDAV